MRRKDILVVVGASVVSAAAASAATWFFGVKKAEKNYEERLDQEIKASVDFVLKDLGILDVEASDEGPEDVAEVEETSVEIEVSEEEDIPEQDPLDEVEGERVFPNQEKMTLDELKERSHRVRYDKIIESEGYREEEETEDEEETPVENLGWDPGDEDIVVISRDIFMENTSEFDQTTLTYFQDGGVIDLDSELVVDHERLIGSGKPPFGQMSEDENIVYIRNKGIQTEYEIIQDPANATDFLMHSLSDYYNRDR